MRFSASGYVLHRKPYRDNSYLADLFTLEQGLFKAVVYKPKGQKAVSHIEPFRLYQFDCAGKTELKTVRSFEQLASHTPVMGAPLFSALYVNELLLRSEKHSNPDVELFAAYQWVLEALSCEADLAIILRKFEQVLLSVHGVPLDWQHDYLGKEIVSGSYYLFDAEKGFIKCGAASASAIQGEVILQVNTEKISTETKRLLYNICRLALAPIVGSEPFQARKLFQK